MTRVLASLALLALAACARPERDAPTTPETARNAVAVEGFSISLEREGGLGSLLIRSAVDGQTSRWIATTHRICSVPSCQAAMDSASGTLRAEKVREIADAVEKSGIFGLADDYGRTPNSADMMTYTLSVRANGRAKSVRGDDGTFPQAAREVQALLERAITEARGAP